MSSRCREEHDSAATRQMLVLMSAYLCEGGRERIAQGWVRATHSHVTHTESQRLSHISGDPLWSTIPRELAATAIAS